MSDAQRYINFWRFGFDPFEIESIDGLVETLESLADALTELREWRELGVQLDPDQGHDNLAEGYLGFYTTDKQVAEKLGFDEEEVEPC
jgi:hypothetical protein